MNFIGLSLLFISLFFSAMTFADVEADEKICGTNQSDTEERIFACGRLAENEAFNRRAWAYMRQGLAYGELKKYVEAMASYDKGIELDPEYLLTYAHRAYALAQLERFEEAIVDLLFITEKEPDDHWNFYYLGKMYTEVKKDDLAMEAFNKSIELKDDYFFSRVERAFLFRKAKKHLEAIPDYDKAVEIKPFSTRAYFGRAQAYDKANVKDEAIFNYKVSQILNANLHLADFRLTTLASVDGEIQLPPMEYEAPAVDKKAKYLQVLLPRDMRDPVTRAIEDLLDWFRPQSKERPTALAMMERTTKRVSGDLSMYEQIVTDQLGFPGVNKTPTQITAYRGLFPVDLKFGARGPRIEIRYDMNLIQNLWPLEAGKNLVGAGEYHLHCPPFDNEQTRSIGCTPGNTVKIGAFDFSLYSEKAEEILVPLGKFKTYVVRYRENGAIELFGRKETREIETKWWIDSKTRRWVKRTIQMGDKTAVAEALSLEE